MNDPIRAQTPNSSSLSLRVMKTVNRNPVRYPTRFAANIKAPLSLSLTLLNLRHRSFYNRGLQRLTPSP